MPFLLILEDIIFSRQFWRGSLVHTSRGKLLWQSKQNIQISSKRKGFWFFFFFSSHGYKIIVLQWSFLQHDHKKVTELSKWYSDGWLSKICYSITTEDFNCIQTSHWKVMSAFSPFLSLLHARILSEYKLIYLYIFSQLQNCIIF